MIEAVFAGLGALVGGAVGWLAGFRTGGAKVQAQGQAKVQAQVAGLLDSLRSGQTPQAGPGPGGEPPALGELRTVLATGWVQRGQEREEAIREALGRIAVYLRHRVEAPLQEGLTPGGPGPRAGAEAALDAVGDLEFFLEAPVETRAPESRSLLDLVQEATREFASQSRVLLKVSGPQDAVRVRVEVESVKDALFLILHNAGEFGGGSPVKVSVLRREGMACVRVRDQGPGFTPEAMQRAFQPLYSTSSGGLGLGLPHARRVIREQGGDIQLRNLEEGGAEVEILLPEAAS